MITGMSVAKRKAKPGDESSNKQPRYVADTAVAERIKERRADDDLVPRATREQSFIRFSKYLTFSYVFISVLVYGTKWPF